MNSESGHTNSNVTLQDFSHPEYYLAKFRREIDRLKEAENSDNAENAKDHGINAAVTAWHLPEWIVRNQRPNDDVNQYRNTLISAKSDYALMHDIATQVKHFKVGGQKHSTEFEVRTSTRATLTTAEQSMLSQKFQESPEQAIYFRPESRFQSILKIDDRDAVPIFEEVYEFLTVYMAQFS